MSHTFATGISDGLWHRQSLKLDGPSPIPPMKRLGDDEAEFISKGGEYISEMSLLRKRQTLGPVPALDTGLFFQWHFTSRHRKSWLRQIIRAFSVHLGFYQGCAYMCLYEAVPKKRHKLWGSLSPFWGIAITLNVIFALPTTPSPTCLTVSCRQYLTSRNRITLISCWFDL